MLVLALGVTVACTSPVKRSQPGDAAAACYIIYDAGSSATRLFIYQEAATGWLKHTGPQTDALSDPVRRNRGKSMSDANTVIADLLIALDDIRRNGPPGKDGIPRWPAFDWQTRCSVKGAAVYASAGMRLAEYQDALSFVETARDIAAGVAASDDPAVRKAGERALAAIAATDPAFDGIVPTDDALSGDASLFLGAAARVEIAALALQ